MLGRQARTLIGNFEHGPQPTSTAVIGFAQAVALHVKTAGPGSGPHPRGHHHRRPRRGVVAGIGQEVGNHLTKAGLVPEHPHRPPAWELKLYWPVRLGHTGVGDRVGGNGRQVHLGTLHRAPLVQSRQQQQVGDQRPHPGRLLLDPPHGQAQVVGPLPGAPAEQLGVPSNRGEGGPQLVRGICREASQPLLRRLPRPKRSLDLAQHRVQRQPEPPDLCRGVVVFDPLGQVPGGDRPRGLGDLVERAQAQVHQPTSDQRDDEQDRQADQDLDQLQPAEGGADPAQGGAYHQGDILAGNGLCL